MSLAAFVLLAAPLIAVPEVSLDGLDEPVARQLRQVRAALDAAPRDAAGAAAFGDAGRHYHAYEILAPAEACYRNAAALAPADFRWPYLLGVLQQDAGRLDDARESLMRALSGPERYYPGLLRLAALELAQGRNAEAERWLAPARAHSPEDPALLALEGELALAGGRAEVAAAALEKALRQEPRATRLHYVLGMAYRALARTDDARRELARAGPVGVRARDPLVEGVRALRLGESSYMIEGHQALRAGDLPAAADAFGRAAEASGGTSVPALLNQAAALAQLGRRDEALARLAEARHLDPRHTGVLFNSGVLLVQAGRAVEAEPMFAEVVRQSPGDAEARAEWGLSLAALRRFDEADRALGPLTLDEGRCRRLRDVLGAVAASEAAAAALRSRTSACPAAVPPG
jgi:Flp pilus assembly protein TadD